MGVCGMPTRLPTLAACSLVPLLAALALNVRTAALLRQYIMEGRLSNGIGPLAINDMGWSGCSSSFPCDACEGDCDYDSDCAGHLKCFQRIGNVAGPSGCSQSGLVDDSDYCYDPSYDPGSGISSPAPFTPSAALLKALLMHGARRVSHQENDRGSFTFEDSLPNFAIGFGSVDLSYLPVGAPLTRAQACRPEYGRDQCGSHPCCAWDASNSTCVAFRP